MTAKLPVLLRRLRAACACLHGDERLLAHALCAEAYHVTASLLLKQEDKGLAWLAADRSVQAANASQSPLMIGSSSRIITHALIDGGHHRAATDNARGLVITSGGVQHKRLLRLQPALVAGFSITCPADATTRRRSAIYRQYTAALYRLSGNAGQRRREKASCD
ncbi:hypothetical protein ACGF0J_28925 [Nonomuraea sp. NPDC047897]|uniref:hypothetical protein n=1 Tax=Nonomuraea sp. NPDC047897 TaxID=3364346 RepID=UPI0037212FBE